MTTKNMFYKIIISGIFLILLIQPISVDAKPDEHYDGIIIGKEFGKITDLFVDGQELYFFEVDKNIKSDVWVLDTKIIKINSERKSPVLLTEELFAYPTGLLATNSEIYFTALSDACLNLVRCDYQDLVSISKNSSDANPQKTIIVKDLRSAINFDIAHNKIFVSESVGNIWSIEYVDPSDVPSKEMLYQNNDVIITDISFDDVSNTLFWIEEPDANHSRLLGLDISENEPKILSSNVSSVHGLTSYDGNAYWNKVYSGESETILKNSVKQSSMNSQSPTDIFEFILYDGNPFDSLHGPQLIVGDHMFLVNRTGSTSYDQIELFSLSDPNIKFTVGQIPVKNINIDFMRAQGDNLYLIGNDEENDSYFIKQFKLPITIPEFTLVGLLLFISLIPTVLIMQRRQSRFQF